MIIIQHGPLRHNSVRHTQVSLPKPGGEGFETQQDLLVGRVRDQWRVYDSVCDHNGGRLRLDPEGETATCPVHGWRLKLRAGQYENGCTKKPLECKETASGLIVARHTEQFPEISREGLTEAPIEFHFNAHASVSAEVAGISLITDPWLEGSCFATGWWHLHPSSPDAIARLQRANLIYVSHVHPDHLHLPTLTKHAHKDTHFLVPKFASGGVERVLNAAGFRNVFAANFLEEITIDSGTGERLKAVIVKSGDDREDSSLIVFTKRNSVLFGVDTNMPNRWVLPEVDVLFTPFAGGASGFPSMIDNFTREEKQQIAQRSKMHDLLFHNIQLVTATKPRVMVPYAGYFTVLGRDKSVDEVNAKNTRLEALELFSKRFPDVTGIDPIRSGHFRIAGGELQMLEQQDRPAAPIGPDYVREDIESFCSGAPEVTAELLDTLGAQFLDSKFADALTVVIVPCRDDFDPALDAYLVMDFSSVREHTIVRGPVPSSREIAAALRRETQNNIEILRVREDSLRGVVGRGLPLEDLSIGFQVQMYREPNVYNFRFWDYFTNTTNIRIESRATRELEPL